MVKRLKDYSTYRETQRANSDSKPSFDLGSSFFHPIDHNETANPSAPKGRIFTSLFLITAVIGVVLALLVMTLLRLMHQ